MPTFVSQGIFKRSLLIVGIWTLSKIIHVFQINYWLMSVSIERSVFQIVQAQGLIWLVGLGAIFAIDHFISSYPWFTKWSFQAVALNVLLAIVFGLLVPACPALIHVFWSIEPAGFSTFLDAYRSGAVGVLQDVVLYYILILSLSYGIHFYTGKKQNELRAAQFREDLTQAKLDLLQSQLQPHFLFNALHSISSLMEENVKGAQNILVNLSDLLRKSLEFKDTKFITLKEELSILDLYLSIQLTRFSDSVSIKKSVDDEAIAKLVPSFILQPLVENTFKHGMNVNVELAISCSIVEDKLLIVVQDDGSGFDEFREGNGIKNVRKRLENLYNDAELSISQLSQGVRNELKLPIV